MRTIAESLLEAWRPACERIEIAGSIRRGKPDPHDIEIVAIPRREVLVAKRDMFADSEVATSERNLLDELLAGWKAGGRLRDRPDKNGRGAWGPRLKRALYQTTISQLNRNVGIDIFSVLPPAQWGVIFAIRTGPADFSKELVTSRLEGGFMPVGMQVKDGQLWRNGDIIVDTPEEDDLFRELALPCWPPADRSLSILLDWRRQERARR